MQRVTGIALIVIGILMIAYTGFHYVTTERVANVGPLKINKEKNHFVQWPPIVGVVLVVGGVVILANNKKTVV
jgi:uncharacterized membrane protein YdcZ (DUF606 family)